MYRRIWPSKRAMKTVWSKFTPRFIRVLGRSPLSGIRQYTRLLTLTWWLGISVTASELRVMWFRWLYQGAGSKGVKLVNHCDISLYLGGNELTVMTSWQLSYDPTWGPLGHFMNSPKWTQYMTTCGFLLAVGWIRYMSKVFLELFVRACHWFRNERLIYHL